MLISWPERSVVDWRSTRLADDIRSMANQLLLMYCESKPPTALMPHLAARRKRRYGILTSMIGSKLGRGVRSLIFDIPFCRLSWRKSHRTGRRHCLPCGALGSGALGMPYPMAPSAEVWLHCDLLTSGLPRRLIAPRPRWATQITAGELRTASQ